MPKTGGSKSVEVNQTGFREGKRKETRLFFAPFALGGFAFPLIRSGKIAPNQTPSQ
jgi:hypothetical protein